MYRPLPLGVTRVVRPPWTTDGPDASQSARGVFGTLRDLWPKLVTRQWTILCNSHGGHESCRGASMINRRALTAANSTRRSSAMSSSPAKHLETRHVFVIAAFFR